MVFAEIGMKYLKLISGYIKSFADSSKKFTAIVTLLNKKNRHELVGGWVKQLKHFIQLVF